MRKFGCATCIPVPYHWYILRVEANGSNNIVKLPVEKMHSVDEGRAEGAWMPLKMSEKDGGGEKDEELEHEHEHEDEDKEYENEYGGKRRNKSDKGRAGMVPQQRAGTANGRQASVTS